MALSNLTTTPSASKKGPDCTVCLALKELPADKAELLLGALRNPEWRYSQIAAEVSSDESVPDWIRGIGEGTYAKHARGTCWDMRRRGERLR